jgi:hypothetical protein
MFKERDFVCFDHGSDFRHERRVRVLLALFRDRLSHRMSGVDDHRVRFLDAKLIDAGDPINQCGSIDLVKGYEVRAAHFRGTQLLFLRAGRMSDEQTRHECEDFHGVHGVLQVSIK